MEIYVCIFIVKIEQLHKPSVHVPCVFHGSVSQRRIDTTWERLMSHAQLGPQNISSASGGNKSESGRSSALSPKRPISANTAGHLNTNGNVNTVSNLPTLLQPVNALSERLELITKQRYFSFLIYTFVKYF